MKLNLFSRWFLNTIIRNPRYCLSILAALQTWCATNHHTNTNNCWCKLPLYTQQAGKVQELTNALTTQKDNWEGIDLQLQTLYVDQVVQWGGTLHYAKKGMQGSEQVLINPVLVDVNLNPLGYLSANLNPDYYEPISIDTAWLCNTDPQEALDQQADIEQRLLAEKRTLRQQEINNLSRYACFLHCNDSLPQEVREYFKHFELSDFSERKVADFFSTMTQTNSNIMQYDSNGVYKLTGCTWVMEAFLLAVGQSDTHGDNLITFCTENSIPFEQREIRKDRYYRTFEDLKQEHYEILSEYFAKTMSDIEVSRFIHKRSQADKINMDSQNDPLFAAYDKFVNYAQWSVTIELGNPKTWNAIKSFELWQRNCPPTLSVNFCGPSSKAFGWPISQDPTLWKTYTLTKQTDIGWINDELARLYQYILETYPLETWSTMILSVTGHGWGILTSKKVNIE